MQSKKRRPNDFAQPEPLFRYWWDDTAGKRGAGYIDIVVDSKRLRFLSDLDLQLAKAFLEEYRLNKATFITFAKEVERFLLWCELAEVRLEDIQSTETVDYMEFLDKPTPQKLWCVPKNDKTEKSARYSRFRKDGHINPLWRPFSTRLSSNSTRKAMSIVDAFFGFLVHRERVSRHPKPPGRRRFREDITYSYQDSAKERHIARDLVAKVLDVPPPKGAPDPELNGARNRYIVSLLYHMGLRIDEACNHDMGDFVELERDKWFLKVVGKGRRRRRIPVPDAFLTELRAFRRFLKSRGAEIEEFPMPNEKTPLIPGFDRKKRGDGSVRLISLTTRRVDQLLHDRLRYAAKYLSGRAEITDRQKAILNKASAHWLRHSYGTDLAKRRIPLQDIRDNMGHATIQTTSIYIETTDDARHESTRSHSVRAR